ncbi:uncharacterized protein LAJ45_03420 [Morchella importuna]|uniref:uncharacterized protein n=1 Tax=Morchella importuna TaxID=1174673 RepID=UPI001E8E4732|nr:uncharacterized protein LAJ45_03420 [Morchella importuna]KAH8152579.1 hypothetical protein LAJ45_03420 [Morchella importuna]
MVQITALLAGFTAAAGLVGSAVAHPGGHEAENLVKRDAVWHASKRSLAACAETLNGRALMERAVTRRNELAQKLRQKRGIESNHLYKARDLASAMAVDHHSNKTGISQNTHASYLFGSSFACLLTPEVTEGPYYVTGEYIRQDVREDQEGVDVYLDLQFIDVNTCEPVPGIYFDIWNANSTGTYSGIVASGNGDSTDLTNIDKTFLRGLWNTDHEGVTQFTTLFPGHYQGRATHTHIVAHQGGIVQANQTFSGGNVTHVGQLFWDETLRSAVETVYPYNTNTQAVTSNEEDMWAPSQADNDYDPFPEYVYLGDDVSEGILAWISIGINRTAAYDISVAATLTEDGGVASDTVFGGGDAGAGGAMNGTMPSGGMPSGVAPSGAIPSGTGAPAA